MSDDGLQSPVRLLTSVIDRSSISPDSSGKWTPEPMTFRDVVGVMATLDSVMAILSGVIFGKYDTGVDQVDHALLDCESDPYRFSCDR